MTLSTQVMERVDNLSLIVNPLEVVLPANNRLQVEENRAELTFQRVVREIFENISAMEQKNAQLRLEVHEAEAGFNRQNIERQAEITTLMHERQILCDQIGALRPHITAHRVDEEVARTGEAAERAAEAAAGARVAAAYARIAQWEIQAKNAINTII